MTDFLPLKPFNNLALSLSGGGYRAAAFHLGLMTYLSSVKWEGKSLLDRVRIISTVSGGTFTGACYAATVANKGSIRDCQEKMYRLFTEVDVIDKGLKKLEDFDHWGSKKSRSLINALSLVYFEEFEQSTFKTLFKNDSHLKEIIFNATEFTYGLPFRFQKNSADNPSALSAFYGNKQVNMSQDALKEVRLADVIAASSCFPGGFEPINFPNDFTHPESNLLDTLKESYLKDSWGNRCHFPIGLMDGGIVDNQGIDSVINAEKRMRNYGDELKPFASDDIKAIDLYIISDVSSPYMDSYVRTRDNGGKGWRSLSFRKFSLIGTGLIIGAAALTAVAVFSGLRWVVFTAGFFSSLLYAAGILSLFLSNLFNWIIRKFEVPKYFIQKMKFFSRLKFGIYETLIKNRVTSVISMVSEVFMKQIRRREYDRVYNDPEWRPRLIMNAIYELTSKKWKSNGEEQKGFESIYMEPPGEELIKTADRADSMATTLWFTAQELKDASKKRSKADALIACGQFTACHNLLVYIEKTFWSEENSEAYQKYSPETQQKIKALYEQLLSDWEDFNINPYQMTD